MRTYEIKPLPAHPSLEQYRKQAKEFLKAFHSNDPEALDRVKRFFPRRTPPKDAIEAARIRSGQVLELDSPIEHFALTDAQLVIAREHGFVSWPKFAKHVESVASKPTDIAQFESAVDAIVNGDTGTLEALLRQNPSLIRERSTREHGATLLHYLGANGVEGYRQKSPGNAVAVAKILLDAGAEVDAVADMYGGDTTLGLIATSVHPVKAGVQQPLMEILLVHGASPDLPCGGMSIIEACLANGQPEAAEYLAQRGARLGITAAAGLGRIDLLRNLLNEPTRRPADLAAGLGWACLYGRTGAVELLLSEGAGLRDGENVGQTPLHKAVFSGRIDIVKLLLKHGAPLEALNVWCGTALGQATWCVKNEDFGNDYSPIVEALLEAGANVDAAVFPTGNERIDELLRRYGAH